MCACEQNARSFRPLPLPAAAAASVPTKVLHLAAKQQHIKHPIAAIAITLQFLCSYVVTPSFAFLCWARRTSCTRTCAGSARWWPSAHTTWPLSRCIQITCLLAAGVQEVLQHHTSVSAGWACSWDGGTVHGTYRQMLHGTRLGAVKHALQLHALCMLYLRYPHMHTQSDLGVEQHTKCLPVCKMQPNVCHVLGCCTYTGPLYVRGATP